MTSPEARALGRQISELIRRVESLEAGGSASQMPYSSVHNGVIPFYDTDGSVRASIGSNGVLLTDPNGLAQSSIDLTGSLASSTLNVVDSLNYRGTELSEHLGNRSRGLIAWCYFNDGNTAATSSTIGVAQLDMDIIQGRAYEVHCQPVLVQATSGTVGSKRCLVDLRYTADGSTPDINSAILARAIGWDSDTLSPKAFFIASSTTQLKLLMTLTNLSDVSVYMVCSSTNPILIWVNEIATTCPPSTGLKTAAGGSAPQQYTKTYTSTWSREWSAQGIVNGTQLVQGYYYDNYGDWRSLFGFDYPTIASDLSGATINRVELFLYCSNSINNDGGYARIRSDTLQSPPGNNIYPVNVSNTRWLQKFPKPGSVWIDLGVAVGNEFKSGATGSFAIDATDVARNNVDAIWLNSATNSANKPALRITYTK